jgi:hypothetical protein
MELGNRIEIADSEGWRKEFVLSKRIVYIGSDARNDIVLSPARGSGVEHRHLQLITPQVQGGAITAVNLSTTVISLGEEGNRSIPPNSAIEITGREVMHLGGFTLLFSLAPARFEDASPPTSLTVEDDPQTTPQQAPSIGLRLALNTAHLRPGVPLDGSITIRNQGRAPAVQFQISVDGFPRELCEIGTPPILFPNAEKTIPLRLNHPSGPAVPAGPIRITIRAASLESYPGESVSVSREILVEPYFHHALKISEN